MAFPGAEATWSRAACGGIRPYASLAHGLGPLADTSANDSSLRTDAALLYGAVRRVDGPDVRLGKTARQAATMRLWRQALLRNRMAILLHLLVCRPPPSPASSVAGFPAVNFGCLKSAREWHRSRVEVDSAPGGERLGLASTCLVGEARKAKGAALMPCAKVTSVLCRASWVATTSGESRAGSAQCHTRIRNGQATSEEALCNVGIGRVAYWHQLTSLESGGLKSACCSVNTSAEAHDGRPLRDPTVETSLRSAGGRDKAHVRRLSGSASAALRVQASSRDLSVASASFTHSWSRTCVAFPA